MTKEFSCLALLYILAADQVQQLKQKEATSLANTQYLGKKKKKKESHPTSLTRDPITGPRENMRVKSQLDFKDKRLSVVHL